MKDKNNLLILACQENNFEEVKKLILESNADINSSDKRYKTALQIACEQDNLKIAEFLIKHGAIVDTQDEYYCSPLTAAASNNNEELVKLILEQDANIEIPVLENFQLGIDEDYVSQRIKELLIKSDRRYQDSEKKEKQYIEYLEKQKKELELSAKRHRDEMLKKFIKEITTIKENETNEIVLKKFIKSLGKEFVESAFAYKEEFVKTGFTVKYEYDPNKKSYSASKEYH